MADIPQLLDQVQRLRAILTDVATGQLRIQDGEAEYTKCRSEVSNKLQSLQMSDPNSFLSLWDWYGYWKSNGLTSYQSRRDYLSSIYRPVIEALEVLSAAPTPELEAKPFSTRHGFVADDAETPVSVYEDAPAELRRVLIDIATSSGWDTDRLLTAATRVGKKPWESPVPISFGTSSDVQLRTLLDKWPWYRVYDFIEGISAEMRGWELDLSWEYDPYALFEHTLNQYFRHAGIGWQLDNGRLKTRSSEALRVILHRSASALKQTPLQTAQREIHEAISDLSRRPTADLTGSIQHAMAAVECVLRVAANDPNPTLGKLLKHHPGLIPAPLDTAIEKAWGYASNMGRHIEEGSEPAREEAELVVGVATAVATYLVHKTQTRS